MNGSSISRSGLSFRVTVEDEPAEADIGVLVDALEVYNQGRWPKQPPVRPLAVFVRSDAKIVAGLSGRTYGGWLRVIDLWVSDGLRGQGIGRELMAKAEIRARERGCHSAWVDTFSFQALGFYKKLGYEEFGQLDYPPDNRRHFMRKRLLQLGER
jgi:GNAT superfamily N-acetyltransferase